MKSRLLVFVLGAFVGAVVASGVRVVREISSGVNAWNDLHVRIESEARNAVRNSGITLPPEAADIHFAQVYFRDPTNYVRITLPKAKFWETVHGTWGKERTSLSSDIPASMLTPIHQGRDQRIDTTWWAPEKVKTPCSWTNEVSPHRIEYWLLDEEEGLVYLQICRF